MFERFLTRILSAVFAACKHTHEPASTPKHNLYGNSLAMDLHVSLRRRRRHRVFRHPTAKERWSSSSTAGRPAIIIIIRERRTHARQHAIFERACAAFAFCVSSVFSCKCKLEFYDRMYGILSTSRNVRSSPGRDRRWHMCVRCATCLRTHIHTQTHMMMIIIQCAGKTGRTLVLRSLHAESASLESGGGGRGGAKEVGGGGCFRKRTEQEVPDIGPAGPNHGWRAFNCQARNYLHIIAAMCAHAMCV